MSGVVLPFKSPVTQDDAWKRYIDLVQERAEKNLWADLEHNKQIARAWDAWSQLFLEAERKP